MGEPTMLPVKDITRDERCQPRAAVHRSVVDDYAVDMTAGVVFPPVTVYHDGERYWLADGFHRLAAAVRLSRTEIACDVRPGTMRDAVLHAAGANAAHGLRRTNADKRHAVETLLRDPEWAKWSDHEIARRCGVSQPFVSGLRSSLKTVISDATRVYTNRYGNAGTMDTTRIARRERDAHLRDARRLRDALRPVDPELLALRPKIQRKLKELTTLTYLEPAVLADLADDAFCRQIASSFPLLRAWMNAVERELSDPPTDLESSERRPPKAGAT